MAKRADFGHADDSNGPVFIGTDFVLRVQMVKKDSTGQEVVETINGNNYSFTLKREPDGAAVLTKATGGSGITIGNGDTAGWPPELTGANTVIVIAIDDTDTDSLEADYYHYEVKRTDAGQEAIVAYGTITLSKPISGA